SRGGGPHAAPRAESRSIAARQTAHRGARQRSCSDGGFGSESNQRPAQQRRESPLDRRSPDPQRLGANLESRHRQGGSIMSLTISTKINGQPVIASAEASTSLLEFLRDTLEF